MKRTLWTRNFLLLVLGQASSLFGNLILRLALSMYLLEVTGSAAVFAGILSAAALPTIILSPLGGVLADRVDRRRLMVLLDALTGAFVLAAALLLPVAGGIAVATGLLIALSVLGAFETPTVQACIPAMLAGDDIIRGNAVVNQIASVSALVAPMLGGALYAALGLGPVMHASVGCFWVTALLECFIRLEPQKAPPRQGAVAVIIGDLGESLRFLVREQPDILRLLLLAALSSFFVMGVAVVGMPYLVRTVLGLDAVWYGGAESALAVAAILGSVAAGLFTGRTAFRRLSWVLASMGAFLIPAGVVLMLPAGNVTRFAVIAACFCGVQAAVSVYSILAVSAVQQRTPAHMTGKVMACAATLGLCAQPAGQLVYGILFDQAAGRPWLVLIPTGVVIMAVGVWSRRVLRGLTL